MSALKKLAGETVIYGAFTIVGRLVNWFLTPLYCYNFAEGQYGILSNVLAYVAFFQVLLAFGMETSYFRFASRSKEPDKIFSTALTSLLMSAIIFVILIIAFAGNIAKVTDYKGHENYIIWMGITLALDTITAIPFAKLRFQAKAFKFLIFKIINISVNILLNLFWIGFCPWYFKLHPDSAFSFIYSENIGIGYAFLAFLVSSAVTLLLFIPEFKIKGFIFDKAMFKEMLKYGWPILVIGIAGMVNTNIEKILIPILDRSTDPTAQLGIYAANAKLAILMNLFIQAFRFSFEPFLFSHYKNDDSKVTYARVMNYFVILGLLIFLGVMFYMDIIKYFIGKSDSGYLTGIKVVPWLLMGNLFLGIFYTQSLWYKLTDQTLYGAKFAVIGGAITLVLNVLFIPLIGYMAAGYAFFAASLVMTILSYIAGQKHFPIAYDLRKIGIYFTVSITLYLLSIFLRISGHLGRFVVNTILLITFLALIAVMEKTDLKRFFK